MVSKPVVRVRYSTGPSRQASRWRRLRTGGSSGTPAGYPAGYSRAMLRVLLRLTALALLAASLAGCGLLSPSRDPVTAAIARCDLGAEPSAAYRDASLRLIDAARAGRLPVADATLLVAYAPGRSGSTPRGRDVTLDTAAALRAA